MTEQYSITTDPFRYYNVPIISKVVEKVISDQLNEFFVKHKLLFDHQYGFRSEHSTEHAAIELTDRIITNIDNKKVH